jgi:hypothetical protein
MPKIQSFPLENDMTERLIARTASLALALVVTLGMLGGIDHLATPEIAERGQWAQQDANPRG